MKETNVEPHGEPRAIQHSNFNIHGEVVLPKNGLTVSQALPFLSYPANDSKVVLANQGHVSQASNQGDWRDIKNVLVLN